MLRYGELRSKRGEDRECDRRYGIFFFQVDENDLKLTVMMGYIFVNALKIIELYALNKLIIWCVNYIFKKSVKKTKNAFPGFGRWRKGPRAVDCEWSLKGRRGKEQIFH